MNATEARTHLQTLKAQLDDASQRLNRAESDLLTARDAYQRVHAAFNKAQGEAFEAWSKETLP